MANKIKIEQVILNIQKLEEVTVAKKDVEIFPVSFFSEVFDLIQQIQSDFHALEEEQVELFALQMKKHQAMILSIHQQMREIRVSDNNQEEIAEEVPTEQVPLETLDNNNISDNSAELPAPPPLVAVPEMKQEIEKQPESDVQQETETQVKLKVEMAQEMCLASETGVETAPQPEAIINPVEEMIENQFDKEIEESVLEDRIPLIVEEREKPVLHETIESKFVKTRESMKVEEKVSYSSVNDYIEKKKLADLRKAFSLNDRFRYRRELFGGSEDSMTRAILALNQKESYADSLDYLRKNLLWDFSDSTVKDFLKILELRFS